MKTLVLLPLLFLFISLATTQSTFLKIQDQNNEYDEQLALKLWRFSALAYCKPQYIENWSWNRVCYQYPGAQDIKVYFNASGFNQGASFYLPSDNTIYMVFRGTDPWSIKNMIDDIKLLQTDYPKCVGCKVHNGFLQSYSDLRDQVVPHLQTLIQKYANAKFIITGHSLGAAMAVLAASDLKDMKRINNLYTFGLPRVGNPQFAKWFDYNVVDGFMARITHYQDPVPHLPLSLGVYIHTNTEVHYNQDSSSYKICQQDIEDNSCANQYIVAVNLLNHQTYMGEDITMDQVKCGLL